ncbi:MAG: ACT domain-containing protein [Spirochaetaceae bacterium]|jgi:hypothetical protein|nr:ACT domain-containing protein [Spirochaetaceae bacterium]
MGIKQISVFLENNAGRLAEVTGCLADAGINLRAISIADTAEFGILRIIVDRQDDALGALTDAGFTTRENDVLGVEIRDVPGSLAELMKLFRGTDVNIEYLYASLEGREGRAAVIFKLSDFEAGLKIIKENGITLLERF